MKNLILIMLLVITTAGFSQKKSDSVRPRLFSISPMAKRVTKVNGMAFGLGHFNEGTKVRTINGLNLEIDPLTPLVLLFGDPERSPNDSITLRVNGLHISAGGFNNGVAHNGVGISIYNYTTESNGVCITGVFNYSKRLKGVFITGLTNNATEANGLFIAGFNNTDDFKGLQIGISNTCEAARGIQIGALNTTKKLKGIQLGLWNKNEKRSLPFINWNFKD